MMMNLSESCHPTFRASSAFQRGEVRSKRGKKSIHFNGGDENIELLLRTVISANQLSVYGAIADLCNEWSFGEDGDFLLDFLLTKLRPMHSNGKPGARIRAKIQTIVRRPDIIQTVFCCGFEACRSRTILLYFFYRRTTDATFLPRMHDAS